MDLGVYPETSLAETRAARRLEAVGLRLLLVDKIETQDMLRDLRPAGDRRLKQLFSSRRKIEKQRHAALPHEQVPGVILWLRQEPTPTNLAMESLILTAARKVEAMGERRDEVDPGARGWVIPAAHMNAGKQHRVPLSERAVEMLNHIAPGVRSQLNQYGRFARQASARAQYMADAADDAPIVQTLRALAILRHRRFKASPLCFAL